MTDDDDCVNEMQHWQKCVKTEMQHWQKKYSHQHWWNVLMNMTLMKNVLKMWHKKLTRHILAYRKDCHFHIRHNYDTDEKCVKNVTLKTYKTRSGLQKRLSFSHTSYDTDEKCVTNVTYRTYKPTERIFVFTYTTHHCCLHPAWLTGC